MSVHLSLRKVICGPHGVDERRTQVIIMGGVLPREHGQHDRGDTFCLLPPLQGCNVISAWSLGSSGATVPLMKLLLQDGERASPGSSGSP